MAFNLDIISFYLHNELMTNQKVIIFGEKMRFSNAPPSPNPCDIVIDEYINLSSIIDLLLLSFSPLHHAKCKKVVFLTLFKNFVLSKVDPNYFFLGKSLDFYVLLIQSFHICYLGFVLFLSFFTFSL